MMLTPLIYCSIILVSSISTFFLGTQGMYVNRTFLNMPVSLFEANVISIGEGNSENDPNVLNIIPRVIKGDDDSNKEENVKTRYYCFDKDNLENDIKNYLNVNLKGKVDSYQIALKYYIFENDEFIEDNSDEVNAVKIRFKCRYYKYFEFDENLSFYIKEFTEETYEWTTWPIF